MITTKFIQVEVSHENKTIKIDDNYDIKHTEMYLEICTKLMEVLSPDVFHTYKLQLKDKTFKDFKEFAEKNKIDLKNILKECDKKRTKDGDKTIDKDLENRFTYHKPNKDANERFELIRDFAKEYAYMIRALCPEGREQALALTKLEETVMWANAGIAREEK